MTAKDVLTLDNVTIGYKRTPSVIRDVSFAVQPGEVFGFVGLNGTGKTTLIKGLLDLVAVTRGRIRITGRDHRQPSSRQAVAYLPERFQPAPQLRGREWVTFTTGYYGQRPERNVMEAAVAEMALAPTALDAKTATYSKGMGQKLGLAGTFLTGCPVLVLDEPASGLDPQARARLKDKIAAYRANGGTVFLSSHDLADLEAVCDRVGVLIDGHLRFVGPTGALLDETGQTGLERAFLSLIDDRR